MKKERSQKKSAVSEEGTQTSRQSELSAMESRPKKAKYIEKKKGLSFKTLRVFRTLLIFATLLTFLLSVCAFKLEEIDPIDIYLNETIYFSNPKWDENVDENERYRDKDRQIYYGIRSDMKAITEDSAPIYGEYCVFFFNYFQAMMQGDAKAFRSYFSESYASSSPLSENFKDKSTLPNRFTKQKLFDISVEEYEQPVTGQDSSVSGEITYYLVNYKILENDGTLRDDLPSSVSRQQLYTLRKDEFGNIFVEDIVPLLPRTGKFKLSFNPLLGVPSIFAHGLCIWGDIVIRNKYKKKRLH